MLEKLRDCLKKKTDGPKNIEVEEQKIKRGKEFRGKMRNGNAEEGKEL